MAEDVTPTHLKYRIPRLDIARLLELGAACAGTALIATAWTVDAAWFDRHFLPDFFIPRHQQLAIATLVRIVAVLLGLMLIVMGRPWVRRYVRNRPRREVLHAAIMIAGGIVAATTSVELILRTQTWHMAKWHYRKEPLRIADPRLGWIFMPSHLGGGWTGGRRIDYVTDPHGFRIGRTSEQLDFNLPTIVFSGESVMAGDGLQWRETIPAQVGARLGVQSANLAVNGYSTDQAYMRLQTELPRFACPVAVVTIFLTSFLERNLNDDRPHLDPNLRWHPARERWRLEALARLVFPYRGNRTIDEGIAMTRAVFGATMALARSRGATALILVPAFMPESAAERALRKQILDDAGLEYLFVPVDSRWRLTDDGHPDVRGAAAIAAAVSRRLEPYRLGGEMNPGKQGRHQCGKSM